MFNLLEEAWLELRDRLRPAASRMTGWHPLATPVCGTLDNRRTRCSAAKRQPCAKIGCEQLQQGVFTDFRRAAQIDRVPVLPNHSAFSADGVRVALIPYLQPCQYHTFEARCGILLNALRNLARRVTVASAISITLAVSILVLEQISPDVDQAR